jgi:hypothetical protein
MLESYGHTKLTAPADQGPEVMYLLYQKNI